MNLNVVLRHELHELINRASADELYTALHAPTSPIRDRFIRFLALSYADWLSTQNDVDDENIKREWNRALRINPNNQWMYTNHNSDEGDGQSHQMNGHSNGLMNGNHVNNANGSINGMNNSANKPNGSINGNGSNPNGNYSHLQQNGHMSNNFNNNNNNNANGPRFIFKEKLPLDDFLTLTDKNPSPSLLPNNDINQSNDISLTNIDALIDNSDGSSDNQQNGSTDTPELSVKSKSSGGDISPPLTPKSSNGDSTINNNTNNNNNNNNNMLNTNIPNNAASKKQFDQLNEAQKQLLKSKLPLLSDIAGSAEQTKKNELLIKKLSLCAVNFDFNSANPWELKGIERKKQMLGEILDYIARFQWYSEGVLQQCIETISYNLFRALPRSTKNPEIEDEPFEDPAWQHLQLVYDLTLRLVINVDVDKKIMKKYLEGKFVDNIIELFASDDPREREYLKTILHRIYGRFMPLRALIRQSIANCCYRTIYERTRSENGIAEFLEIFCSIIHGFSIPVKKEHKDFLRNVLVPLHKCRKLEKFHEQLVACCVQFVFKDPSVASVILGGLLKFWPVQSPTKEEMFIAEVVNVINAMINHKNGFSWPENKQICLAVIDQLVLCMKSNHHSVAERALLVWGEDAIEILIDLDKKTIWPKIVGAFLENKNHWNDSLKECNEEAMDVFRVRDHATFTKIKEDFQSNIAKVTDQKKLNVTNRKNKWAKLGDIASNKKSKITNSKDKQKR